MSRTLLGAGLIVVEENMQEALALKREYIPVERGRKTKKKFIIRNGTC